MVSCFWAWAGVNAANARAIAPTSTEDRFKIDMRILLPIPVGSGAAESFKPAELSNPFSVIATRKI